MNRQQEEVAEADGGKEEPVRAAAGPFVLIKAGTEGGSRGCRGLGAQGCWQYQYK